MLSQASAKGVQFYCPSSTYPAIVLLGTLYYCSTIEQFFIQVPSEVRHTCWSGASKIALYKKVQLIKYSSGNTITSKAKIIFFQFFSSLLMPLLDCSVQKHFKKQFDFSHWDIILNWTFFLISVYCAQSQKAKEHIE